MNDIKSGGDGAKKNAIRTLFWVTNHTMYGAMDRIITECLNSQNVNVVNAALIIGLHIAQTNP